MLDSRMATTPDAAMAPPSAGFAAPECRRRLPFERVALALQGGGALGAYQGGVYQALAEAALHPDWVAGISIGAINAAIIAGNSPESRVDKLREFWDLVSSPQMQWLGHSVPVPGSGAMAVNRPDAIRNVMLKDTVDGEFTTLEDVAETALFLASFGSNALTGQSVVVSHGWHMQ